MKTKTQKRKEALARREKDLTVYKMEKNPNDVLKEKTRIAERDIGALRKKLGQ